MPTPEACEAATSLLPSLEPILGASVALNLAYLNLSKFAYITVVKTTIGARLKKLDPNVRNQIQATKWYRQMDALASVETLDQGLPSWGKLWIPAPGTWGFFYNVLFYWRIGRALSMLAVVHALFLLILGVGHSSGVVVWGRCHFGVNGVANDYLYGSLGLLWPLMMVIIGTLVCTFAARFVKYQTQHLEQEAVADARGALDQSKRAVSTAEVAQPPASAGGSATAAAVAKKAAAAPKSKAATPKPTPAKPAQKLLPKPTPKPPVKKPAAKAKRKPRPRRKPPPK